MSKEIYITEIYSRYPIKPLLAEPQKILDLKKEALEYPSWFLTERQCHDLELLLNGGFSPLNGFMNKQDYEAVCAEMRLTDGTLWPIPIVLDLPENVACRLHPDQKITLRHPEGMILAVMTAQDVWVPDRNQEAELVYGTTDHTHPGVNYLLKKTHPVYVGGPIEGLELPPHHMFKDRRFTPTQLREYFAQKGWERVVAFQTRNPMHRAHVELTQRAMEEVNAALLIHPVVGPTKPGDVEPVIRVFAYEKILKYYPPDRVILSLLPLAMRMAGPREALLHAIIRRNYGATHFIIGRDHAGPGKNHNGEPFYDPYEAQKLAKSYEEELGIQIMPYDEMVYVKELNRYVPRNEVPDGATVLFLSGTELRRRLKNGDEIPSWFTFPEVVRVLERETPPRHKQGIVLWLTGLSGSGKSTIAGVIEKKLTEIKFENEGQRSVTTLDGDLVRQHLSRGLGFSKDDRIANIERVGFVASEIAKHGGAVICCLISPYKNVRDRVREMVQKHGVFIEIYIATPLSVCEERDIKGLYAQARAGKIQNFTGIDDPYEPPENPEIIIDTTKMTPEEAAETIISYLMEKGYIKLDK